MNCIDARNGIDAIFILYEFNCLIAEENRILPLVMTENLCSQIGNGGSPCGRISQTITILRSGMICFFDITNYLHELGTAARRKNI